MECTTGFSMLVTWRSLIFFLREFDFESSAESIGLLYWGESEFSFTRLVSLPIMAVENGFKKNKKLLETPWGLSASESYHPHREPDGLGWGFLSLPNWPLVTQN
jgi:hypothetical protein